MRVSEIVLNRDTDSAFHDVYMGNKSLSTSIILVEEISNKLFNNIPLNKSLIQKYDNIGDSAEVYVDMIFPMINESSYAQNEIIKSINIYIDNDSFLINESDIKYLSDDVIKSNWYQRLNEEGANGQIIWSYEKNDSNKYNLVLYRKLAGYLGITSGVLKIVINETYFVPKSGTQKYDFYNIIQQRDTKNLAKWVVPDDESYLIDDFIKKMDNSIDGKLEFTYENVEYIALHNSFSSNNSQYTWQTVLFAPVDVLLYDVEKQKKDAIVIIVITSLLMGAFMVLYINSFTKRIHDLDEKAKIAAQGNFDVRIAVSGHDEIGRLGLSINKMLSYIDNLVNQVYQDKIRMQEYQIKQNQSEFEVLQNQTSPHFLYNTLDAMRYRATLAGNKELGNMMISLSRLLSYSINQKSNIVELYKEIDHLSNYLLLVKARFEDMIEYTIDIDDSLKSIAINKLTLQPLVENCIKHGMHSKKSVLKIEVKAKIKNDNLVITIADNGRGMSDERMELVNNPLFQSETDDNRAHVGINNVKSRIKLYFGETYGLDVKSEINVGTTVTITLPNEEYTNEV